MGVLRWFFFDLSDVCAPAPTIFFRVFFSVSYFELELLFVDVSHAILMNLHVFPLLFASAWIF